jgi:hypothetical protein
MNVILNRKTRKLEPEIEMHGSCQTGANHPFDKYRSGSAPLGCIWCDFWTCLKLNQTVLAIRTRMASGLPGCVVNTTYYGCEHTMEFHTGDAKVGLPIKIIHPRVGEQSKIQKLLSILHNAG